MKSKKKIYHVKRSEEEFRINDYNPRLLLIWQANIDVQFISEASLALAEYVSGYVTKPERSHLQDLWQVVDNPNIYSKLFKVGIKCLGSREIGLYEACDILLGEPLCRKSVTVQWVDVSMPHKRCRNVKPHQEVEDIAINDPNMEDIYEAGLVTDFYPQSQS